MCALNISPQVIIIQFGGVAFHTSSLTASQWLWCVFLGFGTLLWGQVSSLLLLCVSSLLLLCVRYLLLLCVLSPLCMCEFSSLSMCELSSLAMCGHRMFPSLRLLSRSVTRNVIIAIVC